MKTLLFFIVLLASSSFAMPSDIFEEEAGMDINQAIDLVKGILNGINYEGDVDQLINCVNAIPNVIYQIKEMIQAFKDLDWKDLEKVLDMFEKLFGTISTLFASLKPCSKIPADIQKIIDKLKKIDLDKLLNKILTNIWKLFTDITECLKYFEKEEYYKAGDKIGEVLYLLLLTFDAPEDSQIIEFFKGLLEGLGADEDIKKLTKCITEHGGKAIHDIQEALKYLKHIDIKHLTDILKGLGLLVQGVEEALQLILVCGSKSDIIRKIIKALKSLNLRSIAWHIIKNAGTIIKDITGAVDGFSHGDYHKAGKCIGELIEKILLGAELASPEDFILFVIGFFEGLGDDPKKMEHCFKDVTEAYEDIKKALEAIMDGKIFEAVKDLMDAFKKINDLLSPECKKGFTNFAKLINIITHLKLKDLEKLAWKIITHGGFLKELHKIYDDFMNKKYEKSGEDLGELMKALFF